METIIVLKATKKEWQDKTFVNIETEDGRVGSSTDLKFLELIGKPTQVEVKPGKEFKGIQQYYFNLPKENGAGKKGFAPKDYTSDKKMCALTNAVNSVKQTDGKLTSEAILKLADKYFEWLNTKAV